MTDVKAELSQKIPSFGLERTQVLANGLRLSILSRFLVHSRMRSKDIAEALGKPPNLIAYHLKRLEQSQFLRRAEVPGADGREVWWELNPSGVWIVPEDEPETKALGYEAIRLQTNAMQDIYARSRQSGIADAHPHVVVRCGVNLTLKEAEEITDMISAAVTEIVARRTEVTAVPKDVTYMANIEWYAASEDSAEGLAARQDPEELRRRAIRAFYNGKEGASESSAATD